MTAADIAGDLGCGGTRREAHYRGSIQLPPETRSACDADLMEAGQGDLPLRNGGVRVHTKPYVIKAVRAESQPRR
jgi:hypothetical protein